MNNVNTNTVAYNRSGYTSWAAHRTVTHEVLVCPVRVLWKDYRAYCRCWGFEEMTAQQFKDMLDDHPEIHIKEGGQGRLRSVAMGVGVVPGHMTDAHRVLDNVA